MVIKPRLSNDMAALPGLASDEDLFGSKLEMTLKLFCDDEAVMRGFPRSSGR